jgi:HemX protein
MVVILKAFEIVLAALYLCSAVVYVRDFIRPTQSSATLCRIFVWLTPGWHIVYFILLSATLHRSPVASFSEFFSILALGLVIIYIYLEKRFESRSLGPWVLGLAAISQIVSTLIARHPAADEVSEIFSSVWFYIHMVLVPLAIASLLISAVFSVMYLVLYRSLKRKMFDFFFERFLPLATLGEMNYQSLITGVVFLAINIPFSFALVYTLNNGKLVWDFHYCMYFTYLFVYLVGVLLGKFAGWRGNRLAIYSLASLVVLIITTGAGKILSERHAWF